MSIIDCPKCSRKNVEKATNRNQCVDCYRKQCRESKRVAYAADPEKFKKRNERWRLQNPDRVQDRTVYFRRRYLTMRAKRIAQVRRWQRENPEKARRSVAAYVQRLRSAKGPKNPRKFLPEVIERQNGVCAGICGRTFGPSVQACTDHVVPLSKGGDNSIENIQALCRSCSSSKRSGDDAEWREIMAEVLAVG